MAEQSKNTFPMDFYVDDPAPRPWKFQPTGYLVAILTDTEEGQKAEGALIAAGFDARDVKVYTGEQIGAGKKSLAFALRFRAADRTLTEAETAAARDAAVALAAERHGAVHRA